MTAATTLTSIGREEFDEFRRLIHSTSGIALGDSKDALLAARVSKRMRALGITDHAEYLRCVRDDPTGDELCLLIDAISTNVTSFFREPMHFDLLSEHLASAAGRGGEVRMWSAACSSGEEPYSMAMVAAEHVAAGGIRARILATDISSDILQRAKAARYAPERVEHVPREYARLHLVRTQGGAVTVSERCKSMVTFARINLANPPFPMSGPFDVIMCRNVMIYFDKLTRERLIAELERLLAPGGLLMLGHAESLAGMDTSLTLVSPAVYRRSGGPR